MADDQSQKNTIDDLVRELSKSPTQAPSPKPPLGPPPQPVRPLFPTPKPLETPKPQFTPPKPSFSPPAPPSLTTPKPMAPAPAPAPSPAPAMPGVKEYQSSIRTMNEDISKLKQGQKPAGVAVPRKVEQIIPAPQPMPPKQAMPSQQFKDLPKPPSSLKQEPSSQIYVPESGKKPGVGSNMLFIGIAVVALLAGGLYWFFVLRTPAPEVAQVTPTPTAIPSATPTPDLNSILSGVNTENVVVKDPATDLNVVIKTLAINGGEFKNLNITSESKGQIVLGLLDFLSNPSQQLMDNMGADHRVLLYGQKEIFDTKGQLKTSAVLEKRIVFINEVKDAATAFQLNKSWEASMNENLKTIFQFDPRKQQNKEFSENSYRGVNVRYKNFKYADRSIDYAIVPASNGKSYLVITSSRESMYATIDKLRGF